MSQIDGYFRQRIRANRCRTVVFEDVCLFVCFFFFSGAKKTKCFFLLSNTRKEKQCGGVDTRRCGCVCCKGKGGEAICLGAGAVSTKRRGNRRKRLSEVVLLFFVCCLCRFATRCTCRGLRGKLLPVGTSAAVLRCVSPFRLSSCLPTRLG